MSQQSFKDRVERLSASQSSSAPQLERSSYEIDKSKRIRAFAYGMLISAVMCFLFHNIQNISDMAPAQVKNSDTPGALGAPIAIMFVFWMLFIPSRMVSQVVKASRAGDVAVPSPFVLGAFIVLALYFLAINYL